ncbi:uncharacterized protein [Physcomitrium patens]|uniref:uncharacterized protein isoform X1 n=2 Tax=Physcomitrium patens TaxID=3218 RepID=UPI003CCCAFC4
MCCANSFQNKIFDVLFSVIDNVDPLLERSLLGMLRFERMFRAVPVKPLRFAARASRNTQVEYIRGEQYPRPCGRHTPRGWNLDFSSWMGRIHGLASLALSFLPAWG